MSTSTTEVPSTQTGFEKRLLEEGYGPGAWHGADLKAALADVTPALAYWRPAAGRHNIAEIALHHAYCARAVSAKVSGRNAEPFVLPGDDWFTLDDEAAISWSNIRATVEAEQRRLSGVIGEIEAGKATSSLGGDERFSLILGITCHAVYHAGQIQLIKRLRSD